MYNNDAQQLHLSGQSKTENILNLVRMYFALIHGVEFILNEEFTTITDIQRSRDFTAQSKQRHY